MSLVMSPTKNGHVRLSGRRHGFDFLLAMKSSLEHLRCVECEFLCISGSSLNAPHTATISDAILGAEPLLRSASASAVAAISEGTAALESAAASASSVVLAPILGSQDSMPGLSWRLTLPAAAISASSAPHGAVLQ